jgi:hypothetical protein
MTTEELLQMYREKKAFVDDIASVFKNNTKGHSVKDIVYEVWHKKREQLNDVFAEWIIVYFTSGAKSPCHVDCNSNTANFRAIGNIVDGGYYCDIFRYDDGQVSLGYKKVDLTKTTLTEVD